MVSTTGPDLRVLAAKARHEYAARRMREGIFGSEHFADPSWDLLLDLFVARVEKRQVSISSACIAASVPGTTALRHMDRLVKAGVLIRIPHPKDRRCTFIELSHEAYAQMLMYLSWI